MSDDLRPTPPVLEDPALRRRLRDDVLALFVVALPTFACSRILALLEAEISSSAWKIVAITAPLGIGSLLFLRQLQRPQKLLKAHLRLACLLLVYCILAGWIGTSSLFLRKRYLAGYENMPGHFLGLARLGDWRYKLFESPAPARDLLVALIPTAGRTIESVRYDLSLLIDGVAKEGKGVAIDLYLEKSSRVDRLLCDSIRRSLANGKGVFLGYDHKEIDGYVVRRPLTSALEGCVPSENRGHLAAYLDLDGRVRAAPLFLGGNKDLPSLSFRAATYLKDGSAPFAEGDLITFIKPDNDIKTSTFEGVRATDKFWEIARDKFIFIGSKDAGDSVRTPYGRISGVMVHAYCAQTLRTGFWVKQLSSVWVFPLLYVVMCTAIVLRKDGQEDARFSIRVLLSISLCVAIIAVVAARIDRLLIDIAVPLIALWGAFGAGFASFILKQRSSRRRLRQEPAAERGRR